MAKILLVEDNEMNRDVLSRLLKRRGFEVLFAEDGETAVDKAISDKPDLILMDISLPTIDGYEATQRIRGHGGESGTVPIIALTAHALTSHRERAMAVGCTDFETKPVEFLRLLSKINHYLGGETA